MKPAPFRLERPRTLGDCLALMAEHRDRAKVMAGGQSLMPLMALRMAEPEVVIDLANVTELAGWSLTPDRAVVRAMTVHRELAAPELAAAIPLLPMAGAAVAHLAIRNRGTFGGSLAHADPAAEWPAVAVLLGAGIRCVRSGGRSRTVPAGEFFRGPFTTALADDELIQQVDLPRPAPTARFGFAEFAPRDGDYARAGAVCRVGTAPDGTVIDVAGVLFAIGPVPQDVSESLGSARGTPLAQVDWRTLSLDAVRRLPEPIDDDARDRHAVAAVILRRALERAAGGSPHGDVRRAS